MPFGKFNYSRNLFSKQAGMWAAPSRGRVQGVHGEQDSKDFHGDDTVWRPFYASFHLDLSRAGETWLRAARLSDLLPCNRLEQTGVSVEI